MMQINENKAIGKTKKYAPYATGKAAKCKVCKSTLHQEGLYCHGCAYKKGEKQQGSSSSVALAAAAAVCSRTW